MLDAALVNGRGHMRVGDSSWPVYADEDPRAGGPHVEVITWKASPYAFVPFNQRGFLRLVMTAAGKTVNNRAVGAAIAGTIPPTPAVDRALIAAR